MSKHVITDTNVLMNNINLKDYDLCYLPITVLEELDGLKTSENQEKAYKARKAIKHIEDCDNIQYQTQYSYALPQWLNKDKPDNRILGFAKDIISFDEKAILLTGDINMVCKAKALGIPFEKWNNNDKSDVLYTGIKYIELKEDDSSSIEDVLLKIDKSELTENEYILLGFWEINHKYNQKQFQLVKGYKWANNDFEEVKSPRLGDKLNDCFRDNAEQKLVYDAINDDNIDILVIYGNSGSGKDFSVLANCLNNVSKPSKNKRGMYKSKSILYTRSTIEVAGRKQGFLPGDANDKSSIYMLPARQNINKIYEILGMDSDYTSLVESKIYEEVPLAYMRGCTYNDSYMIMDECANSSLEEVKMFISRAGECSKVIVIGSLNQIDDKCNTYSNNALYKVIQSYKGQKNCAIIELRNQHRSLLALQCDELLK